MNYKNTMKKLSLLTINLFVITFLSSQVVINEYSCANISGPTDSFGDREDWVELYNPSGTPFDLTGYFYLIKVET